MSSTNIGRELSEKLSHAAARQTLRRKVGMIRKIPHKARNRCIMSTNLDV